MAKMKEYVYYSFSEIPEPIKSFSGSAIELKKEIFKLGDFYDTKMEIIDNIFGQYVFENIHNITENDKSVIANILSIFVIVNEAMKKYSVKYGDEYDKEKLADKYVQDNPSSIIDGKIKVYPNLKDYDFRVHPYSVILSNQIFNHVVIVIFTGEVFKIISSK